jgi:hypothetical protein
VHPDVIHSKGGITAVRAANKVIIRCTIQKQELSLNALEIRLRVTE